MVIKMDKLFIKKTTQIMIIIISICFGSYITILLKKHSNFTIEKNLSLLDMANIVTTILLTLYISIRLDSIKNNNRITKDFFTKYYMDYISLLNDEVNKFLSLDNLSSKDIQNFSTFFKSSRSKLFYLNKLALEKKIIKTNNQTDRIFQKVTDIWNLVTDNIENEDQNNILEIRKEQIRVNLLKIEMMIYNLTLEINSI